MKEVRSRYYLIYLSVGASGLRHAANRLIGNGVVLKFSTQPLSEREVVTPAHVKFALTLPWKCP